MALGTYGIKRLSDVSPEDIEILLLYTPSRESVEQATITTLDAKSVLTPYYHNSNTGGNTGIELLGGVYNLRLPYNQFNAKGIYTVIIRPLEIRTTISDCGVLSSLPNVKGLLFDINNKYIFILFFIVITFCFEY